MQIQQVLAQMRTLAQSAAGLESPAGLQSSAAVTKGARFADLIRKSLEEVNATQQTSADLTSRFVAGDESVSLSDAVIASQKASLEFEAVVQVRNRLLSAYQEIMNMPL